MPKAGSSASKARVAKMKATPNKSGDGSNIGNPTRTVTTASGQTYGPGSEASLSYGGSGVAATPKTPTPPEFVSAEETITTGEPLPGAVPSPLQQTPLPTNEFNSITGNRLAPGASYVDVQGQTVKQGSKYQQAHAALKGTAAPSDGGAAMSKISGAMPPEPADTSTADIAMAEDSDFQTLQKTVLDFLSPIKQKDTLLSEYNKLYKQSGIEQLDEEIIDAETIIDGTEDDIRNEVQMAGGFATDSQVQAMALSRNKSLLKRYNQLFAARESAQKRLDTMVQLSYQDKQLANDKINTGLNAMFKLAEFKQQATNNTREAFNNLVQNVGYAGAYEAYKGDARQMGFIEKTMGMQPGGLKALADFKVPLTEKEQIDIDLKREQIKTEQAQRGLIAANTAKVKSETGGGGKQTIATQYQAERGQRILQSISTLRDKITPNTVGWAARASNSLPPFFQSQGVIDTAAEIEQFKSGVFANEITAMREASKTGGAVGNASDREGSRLENALGAISSEQSVESNLENLKEAEDALVRWYSVLNDADLIVAPDGSGNLIQIIDG